MTTAEGLEIIEPAKAVEPYCGRCGWAMYWKEPNHRFYQMGFCPNSECLQFEIEVPLR